MVYKPGQSGNKGGRPPGIKDRRLEFRDLLHENGKLIIEKAIHLAKEGNVDAIKICMDRLVARPKDNPVFVEIPAETTITQTLDTLMQKVTDGSITPSEAQSISSIIAVRNDAARTEALSEKLKQFETFMQSLTGNIGQMQQSKEVE